MGRLNRSEKTSGFQYIHLFSSTEAEEIISWKEESPVFSLTHWIPFGEKMENPDEDPMVKSATLFRYVVSEASTNISSFTTIICDQGAHHV